MPKGEDSRLYEDGRHYDRMFTTDGEHASSFWLGMAQESGESVLELACGTGALAIPLARAGYEVTGLDLSESMLAEARRKSQASRVSVDWRHGDIRDFHLGRTYSLIILASNTICHLLDLPSLEACLRCVREHLADEGRFVVTVFVPDQALLQRRCDEPEVLAEYEDPDGRGRITVTATYEYHPDTQIKHITTRSRIGDSEESGTLTLRMYYPQELAALLKYNGLEIVERWGDHDRNPFGPDSKMQVLTCSLAKPEIAT